MKKNIITIALVVSSILAGVYFTGVFYYQDRFPSQTHINQVDVAGMTLGEADKELEKADDWDKITIKSDKEKFLEIESKKADYKYVTSPELPKILKQQNEWAWPLSIFKDSEYKIPTSSDYNKDNVKSMIDTMEELDKKLLNAQVAYSDSDEAFVVEPHSYEIKLSREELFDLVIEIIEKRKNTLNIEKYIEEPDIFEDDESLALARDKANKLLDLKLKYDFGDREEVIDKSLLKDWIVVKEKEVDVDAEKVREYIVELAKKYDTFGSSRKFKTNTGNIITTNGGTYGWMTHRGKTTDALIQHIKAGEDKTIEPVYSYTALSRNSDDIGTSYVEIDLYQQMVYVYINGELKVKTPTVTGNIAQGHNTPRGVDAITYKQNGAVLRGEDYASPVKYWMPFNGDVGLHDADWRTSFGGDIYKTNGSHGCINLPPGNAKTIFDLVYPGMPVIVH